MFLQSTGDLDGETKQQQNSAKRGAEHAKPPLRNAEFSRRGLKMPRYVYHRIREPSNPGQGNDKTGFGPWYKVFDTFEGSEEPILKVRQKFLDRVLEVLDAS